MASSDGGPGSSQNSIVPDAQGTNGWGVEVRTDKMWWDHGPGTMDGDQLMSYATNSIRSGGSPQADWERRNWNNYHDPMNGQSDKSFNANDVTNKGDINKVIRPYVSYGWSIDQNMAASKTMLSLLSFTIPVGPIVGSLSGIFKFGSLVSRGRVFWSGGTIAKDLAMGFAKASGMKTLEMTGLGRIMNSISPYLPRTISTPIWNSLSRQFAKGATEEVHFFTTPLGPKPGSIWLNIEKPILEQNGVNIITH